MCTLSPFLVVDDLQHVRQSFTTLRKPERLRTFDKWGNTSFWRFYRDINQSNVLTNGPTEDAKRLYRQTMNEIQINVSTSSHKCFIVAGHGGLVTNKLTGMQQVLLRFVWLTTCHAPCCCSRSNRKIAWLGMHNDRWKYYHWHAVLCQQYQTLCCMLPDLQQNIEAPPKDSGSMTKRCTNFTDMPMIRMPAVPLKLISDRIARKITNHGGVPIPHAGRLCPSAVTSSSRKYTYALLSFCRTCKEPTKDVRWMHAIDRLLFSVSAVYMIVMCCMALALQSAEHCSRSCHLCPYLRVWLHSMQKNASRNRLVPPAFSCCQHGCQSG